MKLKYIDIKEHGVLVYIPKEGESTEIKDCWYVTNTNQISHTSKMHYKNWNGKAFKIIFAEKELNLDVPILPNWREWEVEQLADSFSTNTSKIHSADSYIAKKGFIEGYNHNKKLYTEDDLRKAFNAGLMNRYERTGEAVAEEQFIQSLQKFPKYIVMEDGVIEEIIY